MTKNITNDELAIMMKKGFDEIHDKFATKKDLERFATKDDLKRFATKDDLIMATQGLATQKELKDTEARLSKRIDDAVTKEDYSAKLMKDSYDELAASTGARIRQEDKIDKNKNLLNNHETRIKKLELSSV